MITCQGTGTLVRNAVVNGTQDKALVFTMMATYGEHPETKKEFVAYVPCVIFNPAEALQELLTSNGKGLHIEFDGGIVKQTSYEAQGERKFKTEVHIPRGKLRIPFKDEQISKK